MKILYLLLIVIASNIIIGLTSCNSSTEDNNNNNNTDIPAEVNNDNLTSREHATKVRKIFYNVPSPIEMAFIMQHSGAYYNSELLNPTDNVEKYTNISSLALNLGVYGADLSYARMFDQIPDAISYIAVIKDIYTQIGLPEEEGSNALGKFEENMGKRDTLLILVANTYLEADIYLKENNQGNIAALIVLGGWIEALYLATSLVEEDTPNVDIMKRIAEQKFALNNLIQFLKNYDDEQIDIYLPLLIELDDVFSKVEINYTPGEVIVDKEKKMTSITNTSNVNVSFEDIKKINDIVNQIRNSIIEN